MRKPIISRTMTVTKVKAMCVHLDTQEMFEYDDTLPRSFKTREKLEKAIRKLVDTTETRFCYVVEANEEQRLYAMTEEDFLRNAKVVTDRSAAGIANLFGTDGENSSEE